MDLRRTDQNSKLPELNDHWTKEHKMSLNPKESKVMIINQTSNYQFGTRIMIESSNVEVVKQAKILGTVIEVDLKH